LGYSTILLTHRQLKQFIVVDRHGTLVYTAGYCATNFLEEILMTVANDVQKIFEKLPKVLVPEKAAGMNSTIQLNLSGEGGGNWQIKIADSQLKVEPGEAATPDLTLGMAASDYVALTKGQVNPMGLFMAGKIQVAGNMSLAMQFQDLFDASLAE
jgi:putative sterol carrier protein